MESANKAIMMAFGMLVAVMIMAAIVYVFSNLKVFPQDDDSRETTEQLAAFNLEYEIYDKKIMYGVDVISVLNKAKSNNDKYVKGNFFSGLGYNTDYIIDIEVKLKTPLTERIEVTYVEQYYDGVAERQYALNEGSNILAKTVFKEPSSDYNNIIYNADDWNDFKLKTQEISTKITSGTYHLLAYDSHNPSYAPGEYTNTMLEGNSILKSLLTQTAEMSQTEKNTSNNKMRVGTVSATGVFVVDSNNTGWNRATWYPAVYDLKTRKFKCLGEEVTYSEKTGRIIKMAFEEL